MAEQVLAVLGYVVGYAVFAVEDDLFEGLYVLGVEGKAARD